MDIPIDLEALRGELSRHGFRLERQGRREAVVDATARRPRLFWLDPSSGVLQTDPPATLSPRARRRSTSQMDHELLAWLHFQLVQLDAIAPVTRVARAVAIARRASHVLRAADGVRGRSWPAVCPAGQGPAAPFSQA